MTKRLIVWLIATIAALSTLGLALAAAPTPTPEPAPIVTFGKTSAVSGSFVSFTITVTNSGNSQTEALTVVDTLPAGIDWFLTADSMGCQIGPSAIPNRQLLSCGPFVTVARHLNEAKDNFVNGVNYVTVAGVMGNCGVISNTALLLPDGIFRTAFAENPCPATPTPTVAPTQTPTPVPPTATPTIAPTQVPPSPTATLPAPGAPKTGDSAPTVQQGESEVAWSALAALGGIILFSLGIAGWRRMR